MSDLRGLAPEEMTACVVCRKPMFHDRNPAMYRVTVEQHIADVNSIRRLAGLELMTGSPRLARAMTNVRTLTTPMMQGRGNVCNACFINRPGEVLFYLLDGDGTADDATLEVQS